MSDGKPGRLKGRSALITGGASGIGKATAQVFLEEGANVTVADVNDAAVNAAVDELRSASATVHGVVTDVRSMADAERAVRAAIDRFGQLDVLFCNAGVPSVQPVGQLSQDEWDRVIGTNLTGMFTMVKQAVPYMRAQGGGVIITMGSEAGLVAVPQSPAYNASKGGVVMFTRSIALDLIRDNIRVNALCPGITRTPLLEAEIAGSPHPEQTAREYARWAPIGRIAEPREIAMGALFLASDDSSFAVGSCLVLDGGHTAR